MATRALSVNGVDISTDAVAHASAMYAQLKNLTFVEGSCVKLPFADATFDAVVSFETIEHIVEQNEFLDDGLFPDYAIIVRADERAPFRFVASVLDVCRDANIWNVAFATGKLE